MAHRFRVLSLCASIALAASVFPAFAQDPDRHAWFQSLKQPGTGISCCDISDCHRTEADWHSGQWWARVPAPNGQMTPVPPNRILKTPHSLDGEAYVCHSTPMNGVATTIYCFVPPDEGS